jgi:DNA-damage-inducible protein J
MNTTIQIRTKANVKKDAQKILHALGLDLSTAINMYLQQVIIRKGIPFTMLTENGMTPKREAELLKEAAWAMKHGKRYSSTEEMFKDILGE